MHGSIVPILSSACKALYARAGLQAPNILYFLKSTFSFFFNVCCMSISVKTPKPSSFNDAITFLITVLKFPKTI